MKSATKPLTAKLLFAFCLLLISAQPLFYVFQHHEKFFSRSYHIRYEKLKTMYSHSQYVQKNNPEIITDEQFEAYAGGAFLRGLNPILIVHDHPPLGRYIVSLSILLFTNEHMIILFLLFLSYVGIFLIARKVLQDIFFALIPLGIVMNEPLFMNKLVFTPLPEPILLPFIIFTLYFFIRGITEKNYLKWFVLTSVCLGCVVSIRFFVLGVVLLGVMFFYLLFIDKNRRKLLHFIFTLPISLLVLELSYFRTIIESKNPLQVLGIQKYILSYHKSKFVVPFSVWDLLLFNRWHTWWGEKAIISDPQWILLWPISVGLSAWHGGRSLIKKIPLSPAEIVLFLWVIGYSLMLSFGYSSTRYFLPLVPFLYILMTAGIVRLLVKNKKSQFTFSSKKK